MYNIFICIYIYIYIHIQIYINLLLFSRNLETQIPWGKKYCLICPPVNEHIDTEKTPSVAGNNHGGPYLCLNVCMNLDGTWQQFVCISMSTWNCRLNSNSLTLHSTLPGFIGVQFKSFNVWPLPPTLFAPQPELFVSCLATPRFAQLGIRAEATKTIWLPLIWGSSWLERTRQVGNRASGWLYQHDLRFSGEKTRVVAGSSWYSQDFVSSKRWSFFIFEFACLLLYKPLLRAWPVRLRKSWFPWCHLHCHTRMPWSNWEFTCQFMGVAQELEIAPLEIFHMPSMPPVCTSNLPHGLFFFIQKMH